jgi:hypothetical protein
MRLTIPLSLSLLLVATSMMRADEAPPRGDDFINFRFHVQKDFSDFILFVCGTDREPKSLRVSPEHHAEVTGGRAKKDFIWLAAVPKDLIEKLGGDAKVTKALQGDPINGVSYSPKKACCIESVKFGGNKVTHDYEITKIDKAAITLERLSDDEVRKRLKKGSGSGSGSLAFLNRLFSADDEDDPPAWRGSNLRFMFAAFCLSAAFATGGLWLVRRTRLNWVR